MTELEPLPRAIDTARLRRDFVYFVRRLWLALALDRKAPLGWPEIDMIRWVESGPRKRGVLAFRGVGKTTFITAAYTCFTLLRDPTRRVVVCSKTTKKAREFIYMIRQWIDRVEFLGGLAPDPEGRQHRDNADCFDVGPVTPDKDPSVTAFGIDGQLPGSRAHLILGDDIETPGNTRTIAAREELDGKVKEFAALCYPGDDTTEIIYVGTYHHEESLYIKLAAREYAFRTWPLCAPEPGEKQLNLSPEVEARVAAGDYRASDRCLFHHRISEEEVRDRKAEGRRFFAMQFQLISDLGDSMRYPLRLDDLVVPTFSIDRDTAPLWIAYGRSTHNGTSTRVDSLPNLGFSGDGLYHEIGFAPDRAPYERTAAWVDPSGRGADRTSLTIIGQLSGYLWLKFCGAVSLPGESGGSEAVMDRIAELLRAHGAQECAVEAQIGGDRDLYAKLLAPRVARLSARRGHALYPQGWACLVRAEDRWARGQKELRIIEVLDPIMAAHRLIVDRDALAVDDLQQHSLQYQLTRLTRERGALPNDDLVEGLAACAWTLTSGMAGDPERINESKRAAALKRTLEEMGAIPRHDKGLWTHRHRQKAESFPHAPART